MNHYILQNFSNELNVFIRHYHNKWRNMFKINNDIRTASMDIAAASLLLTLSRCLPTEKKSFKKYWKKTLWWKKLI